MDPLQTGDLILFACKTSHWSLFDAAIRHVGMVLIDPPFRNVPRGAYLWESGWEPTPDPQDGRLKLGVRITPLSKIDVSASHLYVRKCERSISACYHQHAIILTVNFPPDDGPLPGASPHHLKRPLKTEETHVGNNICETYPRRIGR
jgi:hypothetical protein